LEYHPYQSKLIKSLRKEPKVYVWDWSVLNDQGAKLENMIASHLLKFTHYLYDAKGYKTDLNFLRDKKQREVDFLVTIDNKPSIRDYFSSFTSNNDVFLVRLIFDKSIIPEISQAKYYFGFIEEKDLGDKVEMHFLSNSEDYIGKWIVTLLDKVEVVEPESLNLYIAGLVKILQKKYYPC